jgi:hypothetical protein
MGNQSLFEEEMQMSKKRCFVLMTVLLCLVALGFAQPPSLISYQGRIVSSEGVPLATGTNDMDFILYDAQSAGTARYTEQHRGADAVTVTHGLFSVTLGGITAFPANLFQAYPQLWLEVVLNPTGTPETFSRVRLVSAPFALEAAHLTGVTATAAQLNELVGGGVTTLHSHPAGAHTHFGATWSGANVGASGLQVTNTDTTTDASGVQGIAGAVSAASAGAAGVRGESSTVWGVVGISDSVGGVWGATASTNATMAGTFGVSSDVAQGVFGLSAMGNGVVGWSNDTAGSGANAANGVFGMTNSTNPLEGGVYGLGGVASGVIGSSTDGIGVLGMSTNAVGMFAMSAGGDSTDYALYAINTADPLTSSNPPGIVGQSADGDGVRGISTGGGYADNGVYGQTNSTSSGEAGVLGVSSDLAAGVYGYNSGTTTAAGYGVHAFSADSVALYAEAIGADDGDYAIYGVNNTYGGGLAEPDGIRGESYDGDGVVGISTGAGYANNGVRGETNSSDSYEAGVLGISTSTACGVYGYCGGAGYGGRFISNGYRGLYVAAAAGYLDAYFAGDTGIEVYSDVYVDGNDVYSSMGAGFNNLALRADANVEIYLDDNNDDTLGASWFRVFFDGVRSQTNEVFRGRPDTLSLDCNGPINANAWDLAEHIGYASGATLEPGDVVVISKTEPGKVALSTEANATNVAGIVSTNPGVVLGNGFLGEQDVAKFLGKDVKDLSVQEFQSNVAKVEAARETVKLALAGQVPCKASAENGPINLGDLLTTSNTGGHAMKATPVSIGGIDVYRPGTIIGKALEPLSSGTGVIKVLVLSQ